MCAAAELLPLSRTAVACTSAPMPPLEARDGHWDARSLPPLPPTATAAFNSGPVARSTYSSRLLTMRDGTKIAVDVNLPAGATAPVDFVFVQARYGRGWRVRWPYRGLWGGKPVDIVYLNFKARAWRLRCVVRRR